MDYTINRLHDLILGWRRLPPSNLSILDEMRELLDNNPNLDLNAKTKSGNRFITVAAQGGKLKYIKLLIQHGADINVKDGHDDNALLCASRMISYAVPLSVISKFYRTIKYLLETSKGGLDPNCFDLNGHTALMNICEPLRSVGIRESMLNNGNNDVIKDIIKLLLDYGADRGLVNNQGQTVEQMTRLYEDDDEFADLIRDYQPIPDVKGCYEYEAI
jgi:ankyrin repeat protein